MHGSPPAPALGGDGFSQQSRSPSPSVSVKSMVPGGAPAFWQRGPAAGTATGEPPARPHVPLGISKAKIWLVKASLDQIASTSCPPNVTGSHSISSVRWPAVVKWRMIFAAFVLSTWKISVCPLQAMNRLWPPIAIPLAPELLHSVGTVRVPSRVPVGVYRNTVVKTSGLW